jgi:3-deoxy-D-manno-octulosonic-acid transferase
VYLLYSVLTGVALLLTLPYWLVKGLRQGKYLHNLRERLGAFPDDLRLRLKGQPASLWVHAVSVGEVLAAAPLAKALKQRFPGRPLVVSTTTDTGQRLARQRMPFAEGFFYYPLDWRFCLRRVFDAVRPSAIIVLETEIWPNFLRIAGERRAPVLFVNGRISPRSFARYQKWCRVFGFFLRPFLRRVLGDVRHFSMQTQEDAERIVALGAPGDRVSVNGNLKYDQEAPPEGPVVRWLRGQAQSRERWPVIVAGSVVADEERLVLKAYEAVQAEWPPALLVLAPRKPERFDAAAECLEELRLKFARRSGLHVPPMTEGTLQGNGPCIADETSVVLLDTIGELAGLYRVADAVFIGGSLVPSGGHNPLEAAVFGKAPVFGPFTDNFREITANLLEAGAAIRVQNAAALGVQWIELLGDEARRKEMGTRAQILVERSRGAMVKTLESICRLLDKAEGEQAEQGMDRTGPQGLSASAGTARSHE